MITRRNLTIAGGAVLAVGVAGYVGFAELYARPKKSPLSDKQAFSPADLEAKGPLEDYALGDKDAPVTIIEYASMTCPHCARFSVEVYPKLKEKYIDTGKVRFIMREYPLDALAASAFVLARCAGPDKYLPLVETLFAQQQRWVTRDPIPPLMAIARQAGFTQQTFEACINDKALLAKVQETRDIGSKKFKVDSTPTFFINGERFTGEISLAELDRAIQPYLKQADAAGQPKQAAQ